ncbi:helix-turn-helix domain-containing protein [Actinophytocola gossypii]|uniref:Helix-turn-helix domain-containing protein n=1 Tax=Actinophytocola gossypii TaxID=2812003 RepID=A0ABT2JHD0_9PSEU|nr:helix-turn-helix transcriptional regulator [Actinophytocola gossypii]MCT2587287.1 helix-turn-helix domain-containing protein [Actinophytocola gossypii]
MGQVMGPAQVREVADELRTHREDMEIPAHVLADRLGWSPSKISRVENGLAPISEIDVVRYGAHCGMRAHEIEALLDMCRDPGAPGFWMSKRSSTLIFHETQADSSTSYNPLVVPGMLQTQEYAAELIGDGSPWLVNLRMERQRLLSDRPFEFFIHEQALRLPVGGNRVMNEQLLKLVLVAGRPSITVRVVPSSLGARSVHGGSFVLFHYESHKPLVYLEHGKMGFFLEDQECVDSFRLLRDRLGEMALSRGESREMLAALASEFDRPEVSPDAPEHLAEEQSQRGT